MERRHLAKLALAALTLASIAPNAIKAHDEEGHDHENIQLSGVLLAAAGCGNVRSSNQLTRTYGPDYNVNQYSSTGYMIDNGYGANPNSTYNSQVTGYEIDNGYGANPNSTNYNSTGVTGYGIDNGYGANPNSTPFYNSGNYGTGYVPETGGAAYNAGYNSSSYRSNNDYNTNGFNNLNR